MKRIRVCVCLLLVVLFSASAQGADRYIYITIDSDKSRYYIDTQSIRFESDNIVCFWCKKDISVSERKRLIASINDKKLKKAYEKLSEIKTYFELSDTGVVSFMDYQI